MLPLQRQLTTEYLHWVVQSGALSFSEAPSHWLRGSSVGSVPAGGTSIEKTRILQ